MFSSCHSHHHTFIHFSETVAGSQGLDKSSELQSNSVSNTKKKKMSKKKSSDSVEENIERDVSRDGDIGADASIAGKMVKGEEQLALWRYEKNNYFRKSDFKDVNFSGIHLK